MQEYAPGLDGTTEVDERPEQSEISYELLIQILLEDPSHWVEYNVVRKVAVRTTSGEYVRPVSNFRLLEVSKLSLRLYVRLVTDRACACSVRAS